MLEPKRIIAGRYEIEKQINVGGFAYVYKGRDLKLYNRPVAIKQLKSEFSRDEMVLKMYDNEINLDTKLHHFNIVQIFDTIKEGDDYYVVFENVDGPNLKDVILRARACKNKIPYNISAFILFEVCSALDYAHNLKDDETGMPLKIVHRDVSPQNIIISYKGDVKIIDFGIAKARMKGKEETHTGPVKGKWSYMSPEQVKGEEVDRTSDLYSLGVVMYELLTGEKLFNANTDVRLIEMVKKGGIGKGEIDKVDAPEPLKRILIKSLEVNKSKRYQQAREIRNDLAKFCAGFENLEDDLAQFISLIFRSEKKEELEPTVTVQDEPITKPGKTDAVPIMEERTIIDVIRLAAYSSKKFFATLGIITAILLVGTIVFTLILGIPPGSKLPPIFFPPQVEITSMPLKPAAVYIDDETEPRGTTPLKIPKITPGSHKIRLELEGYEPINWSIIVEKDKKRQ